MLRTDALTVARGDTSAKLTPVESRLLAALMAARGRVLTRAQLVGHARGDDYDGTERTIDAHIKNLRRKLAQLEGSEDALRIVTTHGVGYHLEGG